MFRLLVLCFVFAVTTARSLSQPTQFLKLNNQFVSENILKRLVHYCYEFERFNSWLWYENI